MSASLSSASDAALTWVQSNVGAVLPAPGTLPTLPLAGGTGLLAGGRRVLSAAWGWLGAHKKEVAGGVLATAAVGGYLVYRKVQPMLAQLRSEFQMMEQLTSQLNPQSQPAQKHAILIHRLEHNLAVGDVTLRQFAQQVRKDLLARFDVDEIRSRMKKSSASGAAAGGGARSATDYQLWDEFKVAGFARTLAAVYICCMLHALIKVQLSVVSRYVLFDQQAQQARQEAEQAARERGELPPLPTDQQSGANVPPQAGASGPNPSGPSAFPAPPAFLPPHVCEEVNRLYFSLSRHAQGVGAAQLSDHIAAIVQTELAPWKALAAHVSLAQLRESLQRIRQRVESEALGLECKTDVEAHSSDSAATLDVSVGEGGASAAGATSASTVSHSSQPFVRFLLPQGVALTSLISSPSAAEGPAVSNLASFRLAEMVAETNALLNSGAFQCTLTASFESSFDELFKLLEPSFNAPASASAAAAAAAAASSSSSPPPAPTIPFATALVAVIKLFTLFLPDVPTTGLAASASASVASPLFHLLADLPAVKEMCAIIYLPADVVSAVPTAPPQQLRQPQQPRPPTTLQQLTANKSFAGNASAAAQRPAASPMLIEEVKADAPPAQAPPAATPRSSALAEAKGLPVFERL